MKTMYDRLDEYERLVEGKVYRAYGGDEVVASAREYGLNLLDYDTTIINGNVPAECQKEIDTLKELAYMKLGVRPEDFMKLYEFKTYDSVWSELGVDPQLYLDTD